MPRGHYDRSKAKPRRKGRHMKDAAAIVDDAKPRRGRRQRKANGGLQGLIDQRDKLNFKIKQAVGGEIVRLQQQLEQAKAMAREM